MKRAAMTWETWAKLLVSAVGLLIIISIVWPAISQVFSSTQKTGECELSVLMSAIGKKGSFGEIRPDVKCAVKRKTISSADLTNLKSIHQGQTQGSPWENYPNEWALKKIVAKEMTDCFNRGWRGKVDIEQPEIWEGVTSGADDFFCLVCSRLRFDSSVPNAIAPEYGLSNLEDETNMRIAAYLKDFKVDNKPIYDQLTEDVDQFYKQRIDSSQFDMAKDLAVVFIGRIDGDKGNGGVVLADYAKLTTDLGFTQTKIDIQYDPLTGFARTVDYTPLLVGDSPTLRTKKVGGKCTTIMGD